MPARCPPTTARRGRSTDLRRARRPFVSLLLALPALLVGAAPAAAQAPGTAPATSLRCASPGYQYQYCPVPTGNQVTLARQRSRAPCRLGETWGYDAGGVWVTQGCAADFRVGGPVAGTLPERGIGPVRPALPQPLPGAAPTRWAHSTYVGFDDSAPGEMRLVVAADGTVQGRLGDRHFTGRITDTWLQTDRTRFRLQLSGTGFLATDERNPKHRIQFDLEAGRN